MFIGLDSNNQRIHALKADRTNAYHCPICQQSLTLRAGEIRCPHFAHIRRLYSMLEPDFATKSHLSSLDNIYFSL